MLNRRDMPFPPSPRVIYKRNPLEEVICQLRFPPILAIAANDPAKFQDEVRKAGFPLYDAQRTAELPTPLSDVAASLRVEFQSEVHQFFSEDRSKLIALAKDFLAISSKDYKEWADFERDLELARGAFEEVYEPAFYSRIGLRYRNVIDRMRHGLPDIPWSELVKHPIAGLLADADVWQEIREVQGSILMPVGSGGGLLRLRYGLGQSPDGPPSSYIIDSDFYTEERRGPGDVKPILDEFHTQAGHLFRWAISPRLHQALDPSPA